MRLTQALLKHHKGRLFKYKWELTRKRAVPDSSVIHKIEELGVPVHDAEEVFQRCKKDIKPRDNAPEFENFSDVGKLERELPKDESHPLYKSRICLTFGDTNVLLEGLNQAKALLNTVQIEDGLPSEIENLIGSYSIANQDKLIKRSIMNSHVYDAMQEKLPIRKDPLRPAWRFPRDYGITSQRRFELIASQLVHLCDLGLGVTAGTERAVLDDAFCNTLFESNGNLIQFQNRADVLVTSREPLRPPVSVDSGSSVPLPVIYPLSSHVSLIPSNFYHNGSIYPIAKEASCPHPHTALIHFTEEEVMNLYELPVTESQFFSRSLTKAFTVAASRAQQLYGDDVKKLPQPITLQVIQTDGRQYHFSVFQLNTLDVDSKDGERNIFWMLPSKLDMFSVCAYVKGRPALEGYNPEVFQRLLAFYSNGLK